MTSPVFANFQRKQRINFDAPVDFDGSSGKGSLSMKNRLSYILFLSLWSCLFPLSSSASEKEAGTYKLFPGLKPITESTAFKRYQQHKPSDMAKLVYLIDRFVEADFMIIYDGLHFSTGQAGNVARWFLRQFYQGQTPEQWIYQWCDRTVPRGEVIWVELPDGSREMSRDILLSELHALEALKESGTSAGEETDSEESTE